MISFRLDKEHAGVLLNMAKRKPKNKKLGKKQLRDAKQREKRLRWLRIGGIGVLIIVSFALFGFYRASTTPEVDATEEIMAANIDGPKNAPVRIIEFGDFGCPSCRAWHNTGIKDQLKKDFGNDISFTFRHFPVITRQSPKAAEASQCASEQGRFWDYHDYIYEQTPLATLGPEQLKGYATAIGLDSDQFNSCFDSGKYESYVARDSRAAASAGARGTPTFFINGQQVSFSYEAMTATIQQELDS